MGSRGFHREVILYAGVSLLVILAGAVLYRILPDSGLVRTFLFRAWPIQGLNTILFSLGLVFWFRRLQAFRREENAHRKIQLPGFSISHMEAQDLIRAIPKKYAHTFTMRRFREILRAYLYREDIIRLNEELSRRDCDEVERSLSFLQSLKNILPTIGFLGTVLGLSLGMIQFPEVTSVTTLRTALKGFAASMSVAFDTTLLALGYTIVTILLVILVRQKGEGLIRKVDEQARVLVGLIKADAPAAPVESQRACPLQDGVERIVERASDKLVQALQSFYGKVAANNSELGHKLSSGSDQAVAVLHEIRDEMRRDGFPHHKRFQLVIEPMGDSQHVAR
ncbi:MAG: hypothetical protein GF355_16420 [Candidatus Eisenbacteria bacterium]|nr:hypothetical protein [Candidatus Eisenbacteria bacterium]